MRNHSEGDSLIGKMRGANMPDPQDVEDLQNYVTELESEVGFLRTTLKEKDNLIAGQSTNITKLSNVNDFLYTKLMER